MDARSVNHRPLPPVLHFSLRSLLIGVALLSVPLTLLYWLGAPYAVFLALSTCLCAVCVLVYKPSSPKALLVLAGWAFPFSIGATFFYLTATFRLDGTGTFMFHALLNFVICLVCAWVQCSRRWLIAALCVTAIVPYALRISEIEQIRASFERLRAEHPLESLEARLAFEKRRRPTGQEKAEPPRTPFPRAVASALTEQEQRPETTRTWSLAQLHENYSQQFAAAAGFGYIRMRRLWPADLEPAPVDVAPLPLEISPDLFAKVVRNESRSLHQAVSLDLLRREKIGYVRDVRNVAGFQSHSPTALTEAITRPRPGCDDDDEEESSPRWQLVRLELVSLLRHSAPRVYLSQTLPEMDKLDQFEHRPLSSFEQAHLYSLHFDDDVAFEVADDRVLMLGALRASTDCLECHEGSRGKLLGALSYELVPIDPPPQETDGEIL